MSRPPSEPVRLVLASASPRRKELLGLLGLSFEVVPSRFDEPSPETHPDPRAWAVELAREKAREVAARAPGAVVVGADTLVVLGERIYGKPADAADAARMLADLSGRTHQVITGVAVIDGRGPGPVTRELAEVTEVTFRALTPAEIDAYAATGEPLDKAGGYAIQGLGGLLISGIRGDYPNVVGLPITPLLLLLRELGLPTRL